MRSKTNWGRLLVISAKTSLIRTLTTLVNEDSTFNIRLLSFAVPVVPLTGIMVLPYLSLSGKKNTNVRFYTLNAPFLEWMATALHGLTTTQINRYYTNCTTAEEQCTINGGAFPITYLSSTINLRLFGLSTHESVILATWKSDKRWQQFALKATVPS